MLNQGNYPNPGFGKLKKCVPLQPKLIQNDQENVSAVKPEKKEQAWFP